MVDFVVDCCLMFLYCFEYGVLGFCVGVVDFVE